MQIRDELLYTLQSIDALFAKPLPPELMTFGASEFLIAVFAVYYGDGNDTPEMAQLKVAKLMDKFPAAVAERMRSLRLRKSAAQGSRIII